MGLDPYSPCPCGSGKKLKFCECAVDSADIEKVVVAIDGDQRIAAIDLMDRILLQKPHQKALLALKAMVQFQLRDVPNARKTSAAFLAIAPTNPVALTLSSFGDLEDGKLSEAVLKVQKAIAASSRELHYLIPDALMSIAQSLVIQGKFLAARAHLLLRFSMLGEQEEDRMGEQLLYRLEHAEDMPLACKQDFQVHPCDSAASYAVEFETALEAARNGSWLTAAQQFESLDKKHPHQAAILFNLGVFQTYLADPHAPATWRNYASVPNLPVEDAVEAELLSQALDPTAVSENVDEIRITYAVKDVSHLLEVLTADHRVNRMNIDLRKLVPEGSPPPRAAYWLLDRAIPASGDGLTREQVPVVIGDLFLFGKETDREARLEFIITKTKDMVQKVRHLQAVGGDQLGMIEKEEKLGGLAALEEAMMTRWRLPEGTPLELRQQLLKEQKQYNMFEVLPKQPIKLFGSKSALEVASEPQHRIRLLALIRSYELDHLNGGQEVDFNELRRQLGLPPQEDLDPTGVDIRTVSLLRLGRYDATKFTNEQIFVVITRSLRVGHAHPLVRTAYATLDRTDLPPEFSKCDAHELLAKYEREPGKSLEHILQAQAIATEQGRSPARYMLTEFDLRIARGEMNDVQRIMTTLQAKYIREPGIAEALYQKLMQLGIINPDGSSRLGSPGGAMPEAAPAAAPNALWTPEGAASGGQQPSKLWIPGMD